jgi:hypothetical protein
MAGALTRAAIGRLEALAELGLLTIDTHFRVPPALIGCVADTFDNDWVLADLGLREAPPTRLRSLQLLSRQVLRQQASGRHWQSRSQLHDRFCS